MDRENLDLKSSGFCDANENLLKLTPVGNGVPEGTLLVVKEKKEPTEWKQERPKWCPHQDCLFQRRIMDEMCGGHLPVPVEHDGDFNRHRFCLNGVADDGSIFDLQVNNSDLWWFRWLFDALDGRNTANMNSNTKSEHVVEPVIVPPFDEDDLELFEGEPHFLHSPDCPSFCDYACNAKGFEQAEAIKKQRQRNRQEIEKP